MLENLKGRLAVWMAKGLKADTWRRRLLSRFLVVKTNKIMEASKMKGSWKTTGAGIGAILAALGLLLKGLTDGNMTTVGSAITGIIAGVGLLLARDNDKTSEDVGAK